MEEEEVKGREKWKRRTREEGGGGGGGGGTRGEKEEEEREEGKRRGTENNKTDGRERRIGKSERCRRKMESTPHRSPNRSG